MRIRTATLLPRAFLLSAGALASVAIGLSTARGEDPRGFVRVDPTRGDVNPLRASTRELQPDLRQPSGFDQVYRLTNPTGAAGARSSSDRFARNNYARINGGLTAVFPRSEYAQSDEGRLITLVPAGTTFYIGPVPPSVWGAGGSPPTILASGQPPVASSAIDNAQFTRVDSQVVSDGQPPAALAPGRSDADVTRTRSILSDEGFRRDRVRQLLQRAVSQAGLRTVNAEEHLSSPAPDPLESDPAHPSTEVSSEVTATHGASPPHGSPCGSPLTPADDPPAPSLVRTEPDPAGRSAGKRASPVSPPSPIRPQRVVTEVSVP